MKHPEDAYAGYRAKAAEYLGRTHVSRRRRRDAVDPTIDHCALPLETFNVADPELFKADLVGPYFARLRRKAPVHFCPDSQYGPYWSITRFDDILAVDSDHHRFSSDGRLGGAHDLGHAADRRVSAARFYRTFELGGQRFGPRLD